MKYFLLFILASLVLASSLNASSEKIIKNTIVSQGKTRAYYLFVPDNLKPSTPAPLIVMLHGSGRNGLSLVERWTDMAKQEGIIIVGPDSTDSKMWSMPIDGPDFLHDLVEAIKAKYSVNPRRVYLFGHSAGASFALNMSLLESEYFAATAVHAGALQTYRLVDYAKRKTPMAIWVGTKDQFFPLKDVRETRDELNKRGFALELTEIANHDHSYYNIAAKINRNMWDFLKKFELAGDQRYEQYNVNK